MGCNCGGRSMNISMGCCEPVLAPIENYYTKYQVDKLIESATTSGCCITPEEVDEKIEEAISGITISGVTEEQMDEAIAEAKAEIEAEIPTVPRSNTAFTNDARYLTEHQSLSGYATEQWVEDKHYLTRVDLSDYVTYDNLPDFSTYATKTWVTNQNYVVNSELIQYITNLQNQIDSLRAEISGCCGDTGETLTRWITMTSENDYTCSGTTKMTKEKEQQSTDGGNTWTDTRNYRAGSTVLEVNSVDCGYIPPIPTNYKYKFTLDDSSIISEECGSTSSITTADTIEYKSRIVSAEIGDCVTSIDKSSFYYATGLTSVIIPNSVEVIDGYAFNGCSGITSCTIGSGVTNIGEASFEYCHGLTNVILLDSLTKIDCYAFYNCSGLTSVEIGSGITEIDDYAFASCRNLQSITINATTPPSLKYSIHDTKSAAFDGTNNCPIYVPSQSVDTYRSATRWLKYADRIRAIQ